MSIRLRAERFHSEFDMFQQFLSSNEYTSLPMDRKYFVIDQYYLYLSIVKPYNLIYAYKLLGPGNLQRKIMDMKRTVKEKAHHFSNIETMVLELENSDDPFTYNEFYVKIALRNIYYCLSEFEKWLPRSNGCPHKNYETFRTPALLRNNYINLNLFRKYVLVYKSHYPYVEDVELSEEDEKFLSQVSSKNNSPDAPFCSYMNGYIKDANLSLEDHKKNMLEEKSLTENYIEYSNVATGYEIHIHNFKLLCSCSHML